MTISHTDNYDALTVDELEGGTVTLRKSGELIDLTPEDLPLLCSVMTYLGGFQLGYKAGKSLEAE